MSVESTLESSFEPGQLERVVRHSNNPYARACAWVLLDELLDEPDLQELEHELQSIRKQRGEDR